MGNRQEKLQKYCICILPIAHCLLLIIFYFVIVFLNETKLSEIRKVDFEQSIEFSIYPNPVKNDLTLQFTDDQIKQIKISDMLGRTVLSQKNVRDLSMTISLPGFSKGLYVVQVTTIAGKQLVQKFVKE